MSFTIIAEKKRTEKIKIDNEKIAKENHRLDCVNKFGQNLGELIEQGKLRIGMTKEMCEISWGKPFYTSKTTTSYGFFENWYYGFGYSLHFENGSLNRIEE